MTRRRAACTPGKPLILIVSGFLTLGMIILSAMFLSLTCVESRLLDDRLRFFFAFFLSLRSIFRLWSDDDEVLDEEELEEDDGPSGGASGATKSMSVKIGVGSMSRPSSPGGGSTIGR